MKQNKKDNLLLGLAFGLPLLLILVVVAITYIPSRNLTTDFDFIYATCDEVDFRHELSCNERLANQLVVQDEKLTLLPNKTDLEIPADQNMRFFRHDPNENVSTELSFEDAQELILSDLKTSPDGVAVTSGYRRSSGFPFDFSGSGYEFAITKGNVRKTMTLIPDDPYRYNYNTKFIGWVIE